MRRKTKMKQQRRPDGLHVLRARAEAGDAAAQYQLAHHYYVGDEIPSDYSKSLHWFTRSAEQGNAAAQYRVGLCYTGGVGTAQDDVKAAYWFERAAEQGHEVAQYNLGICYIMWVCKKGCSAPS